MWEGGGGVGEFSKKLDHTQTNTHFTNEIEHRNNILNNLNNKLAYKFLEGNFLNIIYKPCKFQGKSSWPFCLFRSAVIECQGKHTDNVPNGP